MQNYDIHHEVGIDAKPEKVFAALADVATLAQWWTSDTRGNAQLGGALEFWFNNHVKKFEVTRLKQNENVIWKSLDGDGIQWGSGEVQFKLFVKRDKTFVHFIHSGWTSREGAYAHCTTKWGVFMLSLKDLIEKSQGKPFPKDTQVN